MRNGEGAGARRRSAVSSVGRNLVSEALPGERIAEEELGPLKHVSAGEAWEGEPDSRARGLWLQLLLLHGRTLCPWGTWLLSLGQVLEGRPCAPFFKGLPCTYAPDS